MRQSWLLFLVIPIVFNGCSTNQATTPHASALTNFSQALNNFGQDLQKDNAVAAARDVLTNQLSQSLHQTWYYPVTRYLEHRTGLIFSQYVPDQGYSTVDQLALKEPDYSIYALTDATVLAKQDINPYTGTVILGFTVGQQTFHAVYGHVNLQSVTIQVGDAVAAGQRLGDVDDTHQVIFSIYAYTNTEQLAQFVTASNNLEQWVNPTDFFKQHSTLEPSAL